MIYMNLSPFTVKKKYKNGLFFTPLCNYLKEPNAFRNSSTEFKHREALFVCLLKPLLIPFTPFL
jgi:hypothetical protein